MEHQAKKSSLASGNWLGKKFFITYLISHTLPHFPQTQVCPRICIFCLKNEPKKKQKKKHTHTHTHYQKAKETKEEKRTTKETKDGKEKGNVVNSICGKSMILFANFLCVLLT